MKKSTLAPLMMLVLTVGKLANANEAFQNAVDAWNSANEINETLLVSKVAEHKWISTYYAVSSKVKYDCATIADTQYLSLCGAKITDSLSKVVADGSVISLWFGNGEIRSRTTHDPFVGDTVANITVFPVKSSTAASTPRLQMAGSGFPQDVLGIASAPGGLGAMNLFFILYGERHDSASCRYITSSDRLICANSPKTPSSIFVFQRVL